MTELQRTLARMTGVLMPAGHVKKGIANNGSASRTEAREALKISGWWM
jgi:hypothetical protein